MFNQSIIHPPSYISDLQGCAATCHQHPDFLPWWHVDHAIENIVMIEYDQEVIEYDQEVIVTE